MKASHVALTGIFFLFLGALTLAGMLGLVRPIGFYVAAGGAAALAMLTIFDRWTLPRRDGWWTALSLPRTPELGTSVEAAMTLHPPESRLPPPKWIRLVAPRFKLLGFPEGLHPLKRKRGDEGLPYYRLAIDVTARELGYERPELVRVLASSRMGLWTRLVPVPVRGDGYRVMPPLRRLSPQAFRDLARQERMLAQGTRRLLRSRSAEQFYSVRKYQYPDSIRHLDPRKSAKYGELMTRVYDAYYNHHLVLGLDLGRAMLGNVASSPRREYCLAACLSLAQHALASQDRVSFFAFSRTLHYSIRETRHAGAFQPLFEGDPRLASIEADTNFDLVPSIVQRLTGRRSLLLLFTDPSRPSVQERLNAILPSLCSKHLTVIVGLMDEEYQLDRMVPKLVARPLDTEGYNRYLYACWLEEELERFRHRTAGMSGGVLLINQRDWMAVVMRLYALMRESLRL